MKKIVISLLILMLFGGGYYYFSVNNKAGQSKESLSKSIPPQTGKTNIDERINKPATDIALQNLQDKWILLSDYKGKSVILIFWKITCPACKKEAPTIENLYKDSKGKYTILTVALDKDKEAVKKFMIDNSYTFPVLVDTQGQYAKMYKIKKIPTSFFIDKNEIIKNVKIGILKDDDFIKFLSEGQ